MEDKIKEKELIGLIENIHIYSQRLNCILNLAELDKADSIDRITIFNYAKEITYNIYTETQNISLLMAE